MKPPIRTIYSNDITNLLTCVSPYHRKGEPYRPEMLDASIDETAGRVDAHILQPGFGWFPMWQSKVYSPNEHYDWIRERYGMEPDCMGQYLLDGGDFVADFIKRCRHHGQIPFIGLRLNDTHAKDFIDSKRLDARARWWLPLPLSRFYEEHPEYRLGPDLEDRNQRVHNWIHEETREFKFRLIEELCQNYDLDGIELDFMRHPSFFKVEETTSEERREIITSFVSRVRKTLDESGQNGQHRWLGVRIPCLPRLHDTIGIDVQELEKAGVELFNLSAYYFTIQHTGLGPIRKKVQDAAVYLEVTHCLARGHAIGKGGDATTNRRVMDEQFFTSAHLAYQRGADGISPFNFVYYREHGVANRGPFHEPPFHVITRLNDPEWLARQPQIYYLAQSWESPLPARAIPGRPVKFDLDMAPPEIGWTTDGRLRIQTRFSLEGTEWEANVNGTLLQATDDTSEPYRNPYPHLLGNPEEWRAWSVPHEILEDGVNQLKIVPLSGEPDDILYLELTVS
jgi:hypothetical protein